MNNGDDRIRLYFRNLDCIPSMIPRCKDVSNYNWRSTCLRDNKSPRYYIGVAGLAMILGKENQMVEVSKSRTNASFELFLAQEQKETMNVDIQMKEMQDPSSSLGCSTIIERRNNDIRRINERS